MVTGKRDVRAAAERLREDTEEGAELADLVDPAGEEDEYASDVVDEELAVGED